MNSTGRQDVSGGAGIGTRDGEGEGWARTAAADEEGDEEPGLGAEHLPEVHEGCQGEDGDEEGGRGEGGFVVVVLEGVEAAAGPAGEDRGVHR